MEQTVPCICTRCRTRRAVSATLLPSRLTVAPGVGMACCFRVILSATGVADLHGSSYALSKTAFPCSQPLVKLDPVSLAQSHDLRTIVRRPPSKRMSQIILSSRYARTIQANFGRGSSAWSKCFCLNKQYEVKTDAEQWVDSSRSRSQDHIRSVWNQSISAFAAMCHRVSCANAPAQLDLRPVMYRQGVLRMLLGLT